MNRISLILALYILCSLFSCKENKELAIVGYYEIDKTVVKNRTNNILDYRFLKINRNKTFELKYNKSDTITIVKGKWELESVDSEKSSVKFVY